MTRSSRAYPCPWLNPVTVSEPDLPFEHLESFIDSDLAVAAAINQAGEANAVTPDSIPVTPLFAARLSSVPAWPEPFGAVIADSVAWRVDFLEEDIHPITQSLVYWSTARFYFQPQSASLLGEPILPASGRELYPFP